MQNIYENGKPNWAGSSECDRALFYLAQNKYGEGITLLDKAIIASPKNFHFYKARAYAKAKLKDYQAALQDIEQFLLHFKKDNLYPTALQGNESILFAKAFCQAEAGQLLESLLTIDKYLARMPFDKRASYFAGIVECRLNCYDKAVERINTSLSRQTGDFSFLYLTTEAIHARKLLEWLQASALIAKTTTNEINPGKHHFPLLFHHYYFIHMENKILEAYNRLKKWDDVTSEDEVDNRSNGSYFDNKTCQRCQMAPCHCSDQDFD